MSKKINPGQGPSSFYKLLNGDEDDDFNSQLQIPSEFLKNLASSLSPNIKIRTDSGDWYIVEIEKIGEDHFLTDGWKRVFQDNDLKFGEFLLFKLVGTSTLALSVYGRSGCLKEFDSGEDTPESGSDDGTSAESEKEEDGDDEDDKTWTVELTKDNAFQLEIPKKFATGTGIAKLKNIKLRDGKGKTWPVYVTTRRSGKFSITSGWNNFLVGNKVVIGSTVSFEPHWSSGGRVMEAKVVKKGTSGEVFTLVRRGRGRPRGS